MCGHMKKFIITLAISGLIFSVSTYSAEAYYGDGCDQYGVMAYESLGYCKCMPGYGFDTDILGNKTCKSLDSICYDELGFGARYNSLYDACECGYGDVIDGGRCTDGDILCHRKHGYNSSYNSSSESCECDYGYTLDDDYECVKKQNNVYFTLLDVDTDNDLAIIKSDYDGSTYLVEYGYGCYSFSIERYVGYQLVVNLGTDFSVDYFDRIVLQDDNEVCDILDVEYTYEDSFPEEEEEYYYYVPPTTSYVPPVTIPDPVPVVNQPVSPPPPKEIEKLVETSPSVPEISESEEEEPKSQKGWWEAFLMWINPKEGRDMLFKIWI